LIRGEERAEKEFEFVEKKAREDGEESRCEKSDESGGFGSTIVLRNEQTVETNGGSNRERQRKEDERHTGEREGGEREAVGRGGLTWSSR
jgi:hypothetical protein